MAFPCPACSHLHFETNRATLPTHCTACGHNLSEPAPQPIVAPEPVPTPGAGIDQTYLFAGVAILCMAGWLLLTGLAERNRYLPVLATVTSSYLDWADYKGHGDLLKGAIPGLASPGNSYYVVEGKTYRTTIDRRWRLGDHFEVWYLPESPEAATEVRPYSRLIAAIGAMVVGLFLFGFAFGIFGAALPAPAESLKVLMSPQHEPTPLLIPSEEYSPEGPLPASP